MSPTRFCWSRSSAASRSVAIHSWVRGLTCACERGVRPSRSSADAAANGMKETYFEFVKLLLSEHRPAAVPGLPPFTAGAVGYFSYDVVRQLERIGERAKDDLRLPDCELMFFDRLLAFDHLRHQIHIVAAADVSRESPRRAYDRAVRDIAALERKLAAGLRPAMWRKFPEEPSRESSKSTPARRARNFCAAWSAARNTLPPATFFRSCSRSGSTSSPAVEPFDLYRALRQVNPSPYLYFLQDGGHANPRVVPGDAGARHRPQAGIPSHRRHASARPRRSRRPASGTTDAQRRKRTRRACHAGRSRPQRSRSRQRIRLGQSERPDVRGALFARHAPGLGAGRHTAQGSRTRSMLSRHAFQRAR